MQNGSGQGPHQSIRTSIKAMTQLFMYGTNQLFIFSDAFQTFVHTVYMDKDINHLKRTYAIIVVLTACPDHAPGMVFTKHSKLKTIFSKTLHSKPLTTFYAAQMNLFMYSLYIIDKAFANLVVLGRNKENACRQASAFNVLHKELFRTMESVPGNLTHSAIELMESALLSATFSKESRCLLLVTDATKYARLLSIYFASRTS